MASRGLLGNTIRKKREGRFDVGCGAIFGWWALVGVLLVTGADEVAQLTKGGVRESEMVDVLDGEE